MDEINKHSPDGPVTADALPPVPTEQDRAASRAFKPTFEQLLDNSDELLRLRKRAAELLSRTSLQNYDGLSHLVDEVLPAEQDRIRRLARALRLPHETLASLRASMLDPIHLPVAPLTDLGRMMNLSFPAFTDLLARDHARFTDATAPLARDVRGSDSADSFQRAIQEFRTAWKRAELDNPPQA